MTVKLTLSRILTLVVAFCIYFTAQAQIVPGAIPCDRLAVQQAENPAQSFPNGLLSISTDRFTTLLSIRLIISPFQPANVGLLPGCRLCTFYKPTPLTTQLSLQ